MTENTKYAELPDGTPPYITVAVAAKLMGMSPAYVYKMCDRQEIETRYFGTARRVRSVSLDAYLATAPNTPPV